MSNYKVGDLASLVSSTTKTSKLQHLFNEHWKRNPNAIKEAKAMKNKLKKSVENCDTESSPKKNQKKFLQNSSATNSASNSPMKKKKTDFNYNIDTQKEEFKEANLNAEKKRKRNSPANLVIKKKKMSSEKFDSSEPFIRSSKFKRQKNADSTSMELNQSKDVLFSENAHQSKKQKVKKNSKQNLKDCDNEQNGPNVRENLFIETADTTTNKSKKAMKKSRKFVNSYSSDNALMDDSDVCQMSLKMSDLEKNKSGIKRCYAQDDSSSDSDMEDGESDSEMNMVDVKKSKANAKKNKADMKKNKADAKNDSASDSDMEDSESDSEIIKIDVKKNKVDVKKSKSNAKNDSSSDSDTEDSESDSEMNRVDVKKNKANAKNNKVDAKKSKSNAKNDSSADSESDSEENKAGAKSSKTDAKTFRLQSQKDLPFTLFVGNLPLSVNRKKLQKIFSPFGQIKSARLRGAVSTKLSIPKKVAEIKNEYHQSLQSRTGFVIFKDMESAKDALSLNGTLIDNRHIVVDFASQSGEKKHYDSDLSVFIGNLPFDIDDETVRSAFEEYGEIHAVRIIRDRDTGVGKGFGYIQFEEVASKDKALKTDDLEINGRKIRVNPIKSAGKKAGAKKTVMMIRNNVAAMKRIKESGNKKSVKKLLKKGKEIHKRKKVARLLGEKFVK